MDDQHLDTQRPEDYEAPVLTDLDTSEGATVTPAGAVTNLSGDSTKH
jgi:hypothetical protein